MRVAWVQIPCAWTTVSWSSIIIRRHITLDRIDIKALQKPARAVQLVLHVGHWTTSSITIGTLYYASLMFDHRTILSPPSSGFNARAGPAAAR